MRPQPFLLPFALQFTPIDFRLSSSSPVVVSSSVVSKEICSEGMEAGMRRLELLMFEGTQVDQCSP